MSAQANPPVAKIMDYGKYRYDQQRKEREAKKKQVVVQTKEIRLSPVIDIGDFDTKLKQARKFISKGDKLKVTLKFKGRQNANRSLGFDVVKRFSDAMEDIAVKDAVPKMDGRTIILNMTKIKEA